MNQTKTGSTPPPISVTVARTFIERAKAQHMGKGLKRDRAALEFVCGAGVAARAAGSDQAESLEFTAVMVASRGYVFLEEIAARGGAQK